MTDSFYEGLFAEADAAWLPKYVDVKKRFGTKYGFEALEISDDLPLIKARLAHLEIRFFQRYFDRMVAQETMEKWQVRLQNRFDEIADQMERAYRLYAKYATDMEDDVLEGWKDTFGHRIAQSGTDESEGKTIDTPDSRINADDNYADALQKSKIKYGRTDEKTGTDTRIMTGSRIIENVNAGVSAWMDIDTLFISKFEDNFLGVF